MFKQGFVLVHYGQYSSSATGRAIIQNIGSDLPIFVSGFRSKKGELLEHCFILKGGGSFDWANIHCIDIKCICLEKRKIAVLETELGKIS